MKLLKNMLTPPICAISVALSCAALFAEETITIDNVRQRTPWNGLVDIDYTIEGVTGDPNDYQIEFTMTVGGKSFVASNFWDAAWCDHATANGKQRATWNARADGIAALTSVSVTAQLIYAPVTDASAEFAIVDLSAGASATSVYPVRYVTGDTNRTAQFNIDTYKTRKIVLKKVHAGEFWMGVGNVSEGKNRHRVRLTQDYFLGLFEVTQEQYSRVCGDTTAGVGYFVPGFGGSLAKGERQECMPASSMFYDKIMSTVESFTGANPGMQYHCFMMKLNARAKCRGQSVGIFALPTEAQWEYACRAGTETKYFYGEDTVDLLSEYAWYWPSGMQWTPPEPYRVHEVGLLKPNPWGFYDIYGNVEEWCSDWYASYPAYSEEDVTVDPKGDAVSSTKVTRGGSFFRNANDATSGTRQGDQTYPDGSSSGDFGQRGNNWGFRLAGNLK